MTVIENDTAEHVNQDDADVAPDAGHENAVKDAPSAKDIVYANETITPDYASELIRAMGVQRREEKRAVETYANAMRQDAWILNGMPIIFDEKGRVIDGYHRLQAVVESGLSIRTATSRNVPADVLHTVDQHRKRSFSGVLEGRGVRNTGTLVRLLGRMIRMENGIYNISSSQIGWSHLDKVLKANPELEDAINHADDYRNSILRNGVLNILFFMALRADRLEDLQLFLQDFSPETDPERTHFRGTRKLRMEITSHRARARRAAKAGSNAAGLTEDEEIGGAIMAFNDAFDGDKLRDSYLWSPDLEKIEVPDERKAKSLRAKAEKRAIADEKKRLRKEGRADEIDNIDVSKLKVEFTMPTKLVPVPNLGMPVMEGYRGLREGKVMDLNAGDDYHSRMADDLAKAKVETQGEPIYRSVIITPEIAKRLMRFNTHNRRIQPNHVKMMARDIQEGYWMMNGQPICFTANPFESGADASNTRLLNGQHRLQACIHANEPIEVTLAFGIPAEAFSTYDNHAKRSMLANVKESGVDERVMKAAAKFMWRVDTGSDVLAGKTPSTTELSKTIDRHPALARVYPDARRLKDFGSAGVITYILARVLEEREDFYEDFKDIMLTGVVTDKNNPLGKGRSDIFKAYNKDGAKRADILKLFIKAWEDYKEWRIAKDVAQGQ